MEGLLEVLVEDIKQTVGKAPHEEEDGDEGDGKQGLAEGEIGCGGGVADAVVVVMMGNSKSGVHWLVGRRGGIVRFD
ncbi:hypothetical protein GOP47_0002941 [Adiantum capillus-veneris]|uniref:Uncharacterized protein n=1 Tax=Adiantum capillus-veneris TaxID=13818 RepID=A0A9D4ZPM3_ADICA|nr:hypothetical protein GOP47_0002941 [Adiantum capillus-veneris]